MASDLKIIPVVYMGGSCGDLITSMLDPSDVSFDVAFRKIKLPMERQRLKKPYTFDDDLQKDDYLLEMDKIYTSIPSHDIDYHARRGHKFVGIRVQDPDVAFWAASRFEKVHRPEVWKSVKLSCNINTTKEYAQLLIDYSDMISTLTDNLINLEDIRSGKAVSGLESIINQKLDKKSVNLYRNWQSLQNGTFLV